MKWILGAILLIAMGWLLRRLLRLGGPAGRLRSGLTPLDPDRKVIYEPLAQELETQCAILGISLNDAIEERDTNNPEIAWRLVRLAVSEWERLEDLVTVLLNAMAKHLSNARDVVPARSMSASRFKSRAMTDYIRMHELLDQLVFRSRLRFQLQLHVLRRASEILTAELRRTYRYGEQTGDRPDELWNRFDHYFHDFDVIVKETLLAFRAYLVSLPPSELEPFAANLKAVIERGVRSISMPADR